MKRTYVDILGDYYGNLDKIIDWSEEIDLRHYSQIEMYQQQKS